MATTLLTSGITMGSSTLDVSGSAPSFTARAFVNFNGTGVIAIRASGNVSSLTDNGVGDYTVNFTTAMADANYSAVGSASLGAAFGTCVAGSVISYSTTSTVFQSIFAASSTAGRIDSNFCNLSIFR